MLLLEWKDSSLIALRKCRRNPIAVNEGLIAEAIVKDLKKKPRSAKDALKTAREEAIRGYNPYDTLYKLHVKAKQAVKKLVENEFKKAKKDEDKITFSVNFIKDELYVQPENGILEIGIHIYMPAKKGFFSKLFTGSMGMWFGDIGVKAMQKYVETFAGPVFAKQVSKKTVSNAVGEHEHDGKTSYYCCLKIPEGHEN